MQELRDNICELVKDLQRSATQNATKKVNEIIAVSSTYLGESNHEKLKMFHEMYFAPSKQLESQKSNMNADVDDIFEQAKALAETDLSEAEIVSRLKFDSTKENDRLQLSGLQKKLEALISFEEGLKEQLAPVMNSMQFEDAMRQRIEHIVEMFTLIVKNRLIENPTAIESVVHDLAARITIKSERESFYTNIMHEEAPPHVESDSFFF